MNNTAIAPPSFRDLMLRNFAEIVRLDDAMQILCDEQKNGDVCDAVCPLLNKNGVHCNRKFLHGMIEDLKKEVPMLKLCPREQDGLCTGDEPCPHDCRKPGWECGLEDAALEAAEGFQREIAPIITTTHIVPPAVIRIPKNVVRKGDVFYLGEMVVGYIDPLTPEGMMVVPGPMTLIMEERR